MLEKQPPMIRTVIEPHLHVDFVLHAIKLTMLQRHTAVIQPFAGLELNVHVPIPISQHKMKTDKIDQHEKF